MSARREPRAGNAVSFEDRAFQLDAMRRTGHPHRRWRRGLDVAVTQRLVGIGDDLGALCDRQGVDRFGLGYHAHGVDPLSDQTRILPPRVSVFPSTEIS